MMSKNHLIRKTFKVIMLISIAFLSPAYCSFAQNAKQITGTVSDNSSNSGISGVNVVVKGSPRGITTNSNGEYSIQAGPTDTLVFSFTGYKGTEEPVKNQSVINVSMSRNLTLLQSVNVNVGYGSQRRVDITGAVSSISSKEITELPLTNFQQALQGRAPGIDRSSPDYYENRQNRKTNSFLFHVHRNKHARRQICCNERRAI